MRPTHLIGRLVAVAALAIPALVLGIATPAHASPTISVVNKCGYVEITVNSDIATTADFGFLAGGAARSDVPVVVGTNVFTLIANPGDSGRVDVWIKDGQSVKAPMDYVQPEGCKQPVLSFEYQHLCGGQSLVTVKNAGNATAPHLSIYRVNTNPIPPVKEAVVDDVTVPIGTSYFVIDKLADLMKTIQVWRGTEAAQAHPISGTFYRAPAGCADAPKVSFAATCTGVDITSDPVDAPLSTAVKGQPNVPDRTGTYRKVDMTAGEAVLVKSQDTVIAAYAYSRPASCDAVPSPSAPANPNLPTTGSRTTVIAGLGIGLLIVGALAVLSARRRRVSS